MFKRIKNKKHYQYLILLILLLPQFIINITGNNGWGGDFAQYIQQALNLTNGKVQSFQYYIFNPNFSDLAPPNYYPGFPLLLYPIISKFGVDYIALAYFMNALLISMAFVWFSFLKKFVNPILSIIAIIFVVYSPFFLLFKNEVLADFPFTFFVSLSFIYVHKMQKNINKLYFNTLILFLSTSCAILIKPLGLTLIFAYLIYSIILFINKNENFKIIIYSLLIVIFGSLIVYKFAIPILLESTKQQDSHFIDLFAWNNMKFTILNNLNFYYNQFIHLFSTYPNDFKFFNSIFIQVVSLSFLYGIYKSVKIRIDFVFVYLIIYLSIVLLFPYQQGVRYLIPVFLILIYYTLVGITELPFTTIKKKYVFIGIAFIGYLLPLRIIIVDFAKNNETYINNWGPLTKEAKETYQYIEANTKNNDIIVFHKPRVLALNVKRKSFSNQHLLRDLDEISIDINQFSPSYILTVTELENIALNMFIKDNKELEIVFQNEKYTLYNIK